MNSRTRFFVSIRTAVVLISLAAAVPALAQTGRLSGIVRDDAGEPIRRAIVRAENRDALPRSLTSSTDERGRFFFIFQRSGEWTLTVEAPGFAPTSMPARVRLGTTLASLDISLERREAPEMAGVLAGVDPTALSVRLASADAMVEAGRYDEAISAYSTIKSQTPMLTAIGLQLGTAHLLKKDYDKAEAEFAEILKSDAGNGSACYNMGEVKMARGRVDEASVWYQKASDADPRWAKPLLRLAVIARDKGDRVGAIGYLKTLVAFDPNSAEATQAASLLGQLGG